jgi:DNA replication protein DnaC
LKYNLCERCKLRVADSLLEKLCHVCFRKIQFAELPERQQRQRWLEAVPERFIGADLSHLSDSLRRLLCEQADTGVLLWGPPGVGKSYALCALGKNLISEGFIVKRVIYELLCLQLRDTFKPTAKQSEWGVIEALINADQLIIEDVGTTRSIDSQETDFSLRTLLVLIDLRMEHCRATYISTNKSLENLTKSFDSRIGDRLRTFSIIKMSGESKRK